MTIGTPMTPLEMLANGMITLSIFFATRNSIYTWRKEFMGMLLIAIGVTFLYSGLLV